MKYDHESLGRLTEAYMKAKHYVIASGYASEIDWQEKRVFAQICEAEFIKEAAWVILSCGMRESVVRAKFPYITWAFLDWESASRIWSERERCRREALLHFNNHPKIEAILQTSQHIAEVGFASVKRNIAEQGLSYLQQFPFIGPVTVLHLAKNIGFNVAKPDRHLSRVAHVTGYCSAQALCEDIASTVGDSISVVDLVIWRYATLSDDYLKLFSFGEN